MADDIVLNPGSQGPVIATEEISGVHHQKAKIEFGVTDAITQVSNTDPLPVKLEVTGTIPVTTFDHLHDSGSSIIVTGSHTAGSPGYYFCQPPTGSVYRIHRLLGEIRVAGNLNNTAYGDISGGLTNGIDVVVASGSGANWTTIQTLTTSHPIKNNIDWGHYCYDIQFFITALGPPGDEFALFRWTFNKSGAPIRLEGDNNEALMLVVTDDLSTLVDHQFSVQGLIETERT